MRAVEHFQDLETPIWLKSFYEELFSPISSTPFFRFLLHTAHRGVIIHYMVGEAQHQRARTKHCINSYSTPRLIGGVGQALPGLALIGLSGLSSINIFELDPGLISSSISPPRALTLVPLYTPALLSASRAVVCGVSSREPSAVLGKMSLSGRAILGVGRG